MPPIQTDFGAVLAAVVVAELVVSGPTQVVALGTVVVVVADEAVGVDELGVAGGVLGVVPVRARLRRALNRQPRDQLSWASCNQRTRGSMDWNEKNSDASPCHSYYYDWA